MPFIEVLIFLQIKIKYVQEGIIREPVDCRLAYTAAVSSHRRRLHERHTQTLRSIEISLEGCPTFPHLQALGGTISRGAVGKCNLGDDIGREYDRTLVRLPVTA